MRVLLLTSSDLFAGTERHMLDLAQSLRCAGVQISLGCPVPSRLACEAASLAITVERMRSRAMVDLAAVRRLSGRLHSGEVDLLHAHNGPAALSAALAVQLARVGRCVATQHFLEPSHVARGGVSGVLFRRAHRWVNDRTDHSIAVSEAARQHMLARGDVPASRITVIPNGIPAPDRDALAPPSCIRTELGIPASAPLVTCAARLEEEKDIGSLVAAMAEVAASCPTARCVIAGEGSQKQALLDQIARSGLHDRVRLIGYRSDAVAIMNAGDLFVLPSLAEPFGLVLLEAMALGKPVIATRSGGPLEIVVEGQTGLLVPPADPAALSRAVLGLLRDPKARAEMGRNGRERYREHYMVERMAEATCAVYCRALNAPAQREVPWLQSSA